MAARLPVVATNTGGIAEIILGAYSGFLVQPRDMPAMAEKTITLLKDQKKREVMGNRGRDSLGADFSIEKMADKITCLYDDLISPKTSHHTRDTSGRKKLKSIML
jgi:L-malate glycosyltransferase